MQVRIKECRPLSKNKNHFVESVLYKEDGSQPPQPFPNMHLPTQMAEVEAKAQADAKLKILATHKEAEKLAAEAEQCEGRGVRREATSAEES